MLFKQYRKYIWHSVLHMHVYIDAGMHLGGRPLGSKFHIFLKCYYEMIKGIQHVHVL